MCWLFEMLDTNNTGFVAVIAKTIQEGWQVFEGNGREMIEDRSVSFLGDSSNNTNLGLQVFRDSDEIANVYAEPDDPTDRHMLNYWHDGSSIRFVNLNGYNVELDADSTRLQVTKK